MVGEAPEPLRLGIVIPTLDEEERLPRLLARVAPVAGESDPDRADEVAVVDGGSRDGTARVAANFRCSFTSAARGRGAQLAHGARQVGGSLLLFLHADCVPGPGSLTRIREAFDAGDMQVGALHQRIEAPGRFYRWVEAAAGARVERFGVVYGDSGLCVRRSLYEAVGGFGQLPIFEDLDLSRRLRGHSRPRLISGTELCVSPRRWQQRGPLRCTARNWMLFLGYCMGLSPERLAHYYGAHQSTAPLDPRPPIES